MHEFSPAPAGAAVRHGACRRLAWLAPVLLALGLLSACGWRLQGTARLPEVMSVTFVDSTDRYSDFNRALRDSLAASGARLTENRGEATAVVRIHKDQSGQRVLSVSARNSRGTTDPQEKRNTPAEYEVFYTVEYSVSGRDGELISLQTLELTRDYSYDEAAVLAKQREQAILREALARELAGLIIRRVASL